MNYPHKYDDKTKSVSFFFDFDEETLVPNELVSKWSTQLREKKTPCGRDLEKVYFVFDDKKCAEYNRQALDFAQIETHIGTIDEHEPLDGESTQFSTREDFGIKPES